MLETGSNYYLAWLIYLLAAGGAHLLFWRLLRLLSSSGIKTVLQLCLAAILFTPALLEQGQVYWVPAFMAALMEGLNEGPEALLPRVLPILIVMISLVLASFLWSLYKSAGGDNKKTK